MMNKVLDNTSKIHENIEGVRRLVLSLVVSIESGTPWGTLEHLKDIHELLDDLDSYATAISAAAIMEKRMKETE